MDRNTSEKEAMEWALGVATREGGVDRNDKWEAAYTKTDTSPPARVAWIETNSSRTCFCAAGVATREGGVDRNHEQAPARRIQGRRHPRGWRG